MKSASLQALALNLAKRDNGSTNNKGKTCRTCFWRKRWECGGSIIQYCKVIPSKRTFNGMKKIKVTNPACDLYNEEK